MNNTFELFYQYGGHGGPYKTIESARKAARRLLGGCNDQWIEIYFQAETGFKYRETIRPEAFTRIVAEASKYPLGLRIAARLHLDNHTADELSGLRWPLGTPDPLKVTIVNHLRDIENGLVALDGTLTDLAEKLG